MKIRGNKYVAKFSSSTDLYSIVKAEFIAMMKLAALAGLNVAPVKLAMATNKEVPLIERFDREKNARVVYFSDDVREGQFLNLS